MRIFSVGVLMLVLILIGIPKSWAQGNSNGSNSHRLNVAIGMISDPNGDGTTSSGVDARFDYSYFSQTWHQALASAWYFNESGHSGIAVSSEYRWRFGGHGIAYYGLGLGYISGISSGGINSGLFTSVLGVDLGPIFLESRGLSTSGGVGSSFMVGYRF